MIRKLTIVLLVLVAQVCAATPFYTERLSKIALAVGVTIPDTIGSNANNAETIFWDRMTEFLKYSKKNTDGSSDLVGKLLNGGTSVVVAATTTYILPDGAMVYGEYNGQPEADSEIGWFSIAVDLDGPKKGAQTWGKDTFDFEV